jgi:hypothetical protein
LGKALPMFFLFFNQVFKVASAYGGKLFVTLTRNTFGFFVQIFLH